MQVQDFQCPEHVESILCYVDKPVALQIEFPKRGQVSKLPTFDPADQVVFQMHHLKLCQPVEGLVADGSNLAVVQEQGLDSLAPDEGLALQHSCKVVSVQVYSGSVHWDQWRDVGVASVGTLDDVGAPGGVVEAGAALRTLHAAVAGKEVTAHAQCEAVRLVGAQEVSLFELLHLDRGRVAVLVVQLALNLVGICNPGVLPVLGHLVDLLEPLHLAVAHQRVLRE